MGHSASIARAESVKPDDGSDIEEGNFALALAEVIRLRALIKAHAPDRVARFHEVLTTYKTELQKRLDDIKAKLEAGGESELDAEVKALLLEREAVIFGTTDLCDDVAKMIPEMDGEIAKAFEETDTNGSGNLGFEEFKLGFTKVFVSCMDDKADINLITEEYRMKTFDDIDANHNRLLSRGEFATFCRHLMAKATTLTIEAGSVKVFSDKVTALSGRGVVEVAETQSEPELTPKVLEQ
jgi:hypothetical protein